MNTVTILTTDLLAAIEALAYQAEDYLYRADWAESDSDSVTPEEYRTLADDCTTTADRLRAVYAQHEAKEAAA